MHFLADTLPITFLSCGLSFLVPWASRAEIQKSLPKRFKNFKNIKVIIDCCEFYIQTPLIPESQKTTWSNYKHYNAVTLLVGITFIPPLWTGSSSEKEMVRNSGLIDCLKEGDAVMADKGFLVRDLLVFKKIQLISPAYCRRPRLPSKVVIYTQRVAALRSHDQRSILKLKKFRILSGVTAAFETNVGSHCVCLCINGKTADKVSQVLTTLLTPLQSQKNLFYSNVYYLPLMEIGVMVLLVIL